MRKNIGEKELGHPFRINVFCAGAVNYPLSKAMVYRYGGKGEGVIDGQRGQSRYCGMSVYLGCLAVSTSCNEFAEEGRHPWPPVVPLHAMESSEEPFVTSGGGVME